MNLQRYLGKKHYCRLSSSLKEVIEETILCKQEQLKALRLEYGSRSLGTVTVNQCLQGGKNVPYLFCNASFADSKEGILIRGLSLPQLQQELPGFPNGAPYSEALLWILLTSTVPSHEQVESLKLELQNRINMNLSENFAAQIQALPTDLNPMTQFSMALLLFQEKSKFRRAKMIGVHKTKYWESTLEDVLDIISVLPGIAANIYRRLNSGIGVIDRGSSGTLDYSASFCGMLGFESSEFENFMRLYMLTHADHEAGSASTHATHLAGSVLSDPYLAYSAGLNALAGPLHGQASQAALSWLLSLQTTLVKEGGEMSKEAAIKYAWETLNGGKVIPGYGHAVLRVPDPRHAILNRFAKDHFPDDPLFKIASHMNDVVPAILKENGKVKNPHANVDGLSGVMLWHYGLREVRFYPVLYGVSRAFGALTQLFWDRALSMPMEHPKSVTLEFLKGYFSKQS